MVSPIREGDSEIAEASFDQAATKRRADTKKAFQEKMMMLKEKLRQEAGGRFTAKYLQEQVDKIPKLTRPTDGFTDYEIAQHGRKAKLSVVADTSVVRCPADPLTVHHSFPKNQVKWLWLGVPGYTITPDSWAFSDALQATRTAQKKSLVVDATKLDYAIQFYKMAFGAEEMSRTSRSAELKLDSFVFVVSSDDSSLGSDVLAVTGVALYCLEAENVEAAIDRSVAVGAIAEGEISEGIIPGGRVAKVKDPYGFVLIIYSPPKSCEMEIWGKPSSDSTFDVDMLV